MTFWLYSNGVPVTTQSVSLTYTDLTGKVIDTLNDTAYDEFMDTVDLYNSLFSRGDPVLTFTVVYSIETVDNLSSKYKILLDKVDVTDTVTNKKVCGLKLEKNEIIYQSKPVYNLSGNLIAEENVLTIDSFGYYYEHKKNIDKYNVIIILNGVKSIVKYAFDGCASLESIVIPDSVKIIHIAAFYGCTSLENVTVKAKTPPKLMDEINFYCSSLSDFAIYVPAESVNAYKKAKGWKKYAKYIKSIE